ncbi:glycoside hydrolase [Stachybotrys elegans]|uniref:lytic cellulose monooxygenase (C4-dehydrogenating) n=1 Tax=Stachybotrys elegans TaxID=80388 RepID=A0A8K0SG33_9HYPO|nr:glycoside hydrolase [Stachybotrys elegans]
MVNFGIVCLLLPSLVAGHGYLKNIQVNGQLYPAWQVGSDDYITPAPVRYARRILDNGPVIDFTTKNLTCNQGGNIPSQGTISVKAGDKVTMIWDQWNSAHSGPVLDYIARCTNDDCSSFKGDTGNVWVKIGQLSYNPSANPKWASDFLRERGAKWDVVIPQNLAPGSYLLRHEILGLHVAGQRMGAQFYPSCTQIKVTSGGTTQLPSGISLPGAYNPDDKQGILVELWRIEQGQIGYTAPGGAVWSGAAPNPNRSGP